MGQPQEAPGPASFYRQGKFDKAFELLTEVLTGIEEISENEEEEYKEAGGRRN